MLLFPDSGGGDRAVQVRIPIPTVGLIALTKSGGAFVPFFFAPVEVIVIDSSRINVSNYFNFNRL